MRRGNCRRRALEDLPGRRRRRWPGSVAAATVVVTLSPGNADGGARVRRGGDPRLPSLAVMKHRLDDLAARCWR
ncbi:MAG: hypothetical protein MZV49_16095 [Rhodopseudomonas palustris]|nr:hypothetical protein [Rhodopseudomonas palustris]